MTTNIPTETMASQLPRLLRRLQFALHNDARVGPIVVIDDLELYPSEGLNDDALCSTLTLKTWQRVKVLVASGAVDRPLQQAS